MKIHRIGVLLAFAVTVAIGQPTSVKINNLTWTKKNINIETVNSWCYNSSSDCSKYGRLYSWDAAKKVCQRVGDGWRLPTRADWNDLIDYAGGEETAGKALKSRSGWPTMGLRDGNGTDKYGFSALPGGNHSRVSMTNYQYVGSHGHWWVAPEAGKDDAFYKSMYDEDDHIGEGSGKENGHSVRCVKN